MLKFLTFIDDFVPIFVVYIFMLLIYTSILQLSKNLDPSQIHCIGEFFFVISCEYIIDALVKILV